MNEIGTLFESDVMGFGRNRLERLGAGLLLSRSLIQTATQGGGRRRLANNSFAADYCDSRTRVDIAAGESRVSCELVAQRSASWGELRKLSAPTARPR